MMRSVIPEAKEALHRWALSQTDQLAVLGLPINVSLSELDTLRGPDVNSTH